MSSPSEAEALAETRRAALDDLKGKENPFESLARPQRMDDRFLDLHVPELLAGERKLLLQIIDRYRVAEFNRAADLPATRVVTILGDRGAGKTHLLESLAYRADGKSQILVRPSYYNSDLPFEEYLLSQLVRTLLAEDEVFHSRPIEDMAAALARRLLRHAIRSLGPTDRIFALSPGRWQRWSLLIGGADQSNQKLERLAAVLEDPPVGRDLPEWLWHHGLPPSQAMRLVLGHLRKYEAGSDLLGGLRREVYAAMAQAAIDSDSEPLFRLLEGGFAEAGNGLSPRTEIVTRLLHTLTEVCALTRQPIVFAFDNLERLFSPKNQFDGGLTQAFFNTLAQAVDNTRGLLVLLFAETGLFDRVAGHMDAFARDRLGQGVPIYAQGPISQISLRPPAVDMIGVLVKERVGRLLAGMPEHANLGDSFPFSESFLGKEGSAAQNLRITLTRLRDEYSRLVYAQTPPIQETAKPLPTSETMLESAWKEQVTAAGRKMTGSPAPYLKDIHAGLGSLLNLLLPLPLDDWVLHNVQSTDSVGNNPTYGVVSVLHWRHNSTNGDGTLLRMGLGFLLARGAGMPNDLKAKFEFFHNAAAADRLLIFWPTTNDGDDLVALLPLGTRAVWDKAKASQKTELRRVDLSDLQMLLALQPWETAVQELADRPVPPEAKQAFVKERFQGLLQLCRPPGLRKEKVAADED